MSDKKAIIIHVKSEFKKILEKHLDRCNGKYSTMSHLILNCISDQIEKDSKSIFYNKEIE